MKVLPNIFFYFLLNDHECFFFDKSQIDFIMFAPDSGQIFHVHYLLQNNFESTFLFNMSIFLYLLWYSRRLYCSDDSWFFTDELIKLMRKLISLTSPLIMVKFNIHQLNILINVFILDTPLSF